MAIYLPYGCYCFGIPTPMTLASGGGGSDVPACRPPASFSVTPAVFVPKSSGDNVVRMCVQFKI